MSESAFSDRPSFAPEFYATLATKHVASACVFLDDNDRVLLVKPTYKEPWDLPGGAVEVDESPHAACRREVAEELGLDCWPQRLLGVDYRRSVPDVRGDALRFIFFGGVLSESDTEHIRLAIGELSDWRFFALEELDGVVIPAMARRLRAVLGSPGLAYLEEGSPPAPR